MNRRAVLIGSILALTGAYYSGTAEAGPPAGSDPTCGRETCSVNFPGELALTQPHDYETVTELTVRSRGGLLLIIASVEVDNIGTSYSPWHGTIDVRIRNLQTGKVMGFHQWYSNFDAGRGKTIQQHRATTIPLFMTEHGGKGEVVTYRLEARGAPNPATQSAGWVVRGAHISVDEVR